MHKGKKGKEGVSPKINESPSSVLHNRESSANRNVKSKLVTQPFLNLNQNDEDCDTILTKAPVNENQSAFNILMDDDYENNKVSDPDPEESEKEFDIPSSSKTKKKKKANRKVKKEEDLDQILAEYQGLQTGSKPLQTDCGDKSQNEQNKDTTQDTTNADENENENEGSHIKTAAQKKKEKKERQKREAKLAKEREAHLPPPAEEPAIPETLVKSVSEKPLDTLQVDGDILDNQLQDTENSGKSKSKKKNKAEKKLEKEQENGKKETKKAPSKLIAAVKEQIQKRKEEEERQRQLEEERLRKEEEREQQRLDAIRLEAERKARKKQREAARKLRLKEEGKLLTKKQKEDRARAQQMLELLKAQGIDVPDPAEKRIRPGTRVRVNKKKGHLDANKEQSFEDEEQNQIEIIDEIHFANTKKEESEKIKDAWDASDSDEDFTEPPSVSVVLPKGIIQGTEGNVTNNLDDDIDESDISDLESNDSEQTRDELQNDDNHANDSENRRVSAEARIFARKNEAESKRNAQDLRAGVICVLGHVDTGKTKILDKLRRTNVQDSEAGGITQQIGATNVPIDAIKKQTKHIKKPSSFEFQLPGLLIIDTPGHESFSNLRNRGSSLCDFAILVVDIMHGLEQQTIESIKLLKDKKCPFIVALNKIDRLLDWQVTTQRDVYDTIKEQELRTQNHFRERANKVMVEFQEQGLNSALLWENPNPKEYITLVPTSAHTGEGMGNLLFTIVNFCQELLSKRLMYCEELQATVLEVKAVHGLGTTIDVILINGRLREGQTMVLAGTDGPIVTNIRSLLMPQPMKELRVKNAYVEYKEIKAAQGVKIAAKDLEKAIAGINLLVAHNPDEIDICKEQIEAELKSALSHIKLAQIGVYVQASTLGSLEALLEFLRTSKIPYSSIRIGPVVKRDIMRASTMLEHKAEFATILAFDVKIEHEAQEMADKLGVKIFQADIIYHLFDKFMAYREELKQKKRDEFSSVAVFPCKLSIIKNCIFNSRDPIVIGVKVENGIVKIGTPLCVPSKEFIDIGVITSIESNHKQLESARKDQEVCIKIDPIPGETPKSLGRHFTADDLLVSKISRQSIDACKDYFRDDLVKQDWALMVELKKQFGIL